MNGVRERGTEQRQDAAQRSARPVASAEAGRGAAEQPEPGGNPLDASETSQFAHDAPETGTRAGAIRPPAGAAPLVAFAMTDDEGRMLASRNAHTVFYAASTVKLGLMLAVVIAAERGELSLQDRLECHRVFTCVDQDGATETFGLEPEDSDASFPADGTMATVADLVAMMIDRSSNEATNVLFDRVGPGRIAEAFRLCRATGSRMERRIGDPCAVRAGLTNETTAADLVAVMRAIISGRLTTRRNADWMREVLEDQEHPRIGTVVRDGVPWGSKSGDVPGIEHDVAFVGPAVSRRFLAICTRGYEAEPGREAIRALAAALLP
jgi:beta-lactamase class A